MKNEQVLFQNKSAPLLTVTSMHLNYYRNSDLKMNQAYKPNKEHNTEKEKEKTKTIK